MTNGNPSPGQVPTILHGAFDLRSDREDILASWEAILGSIPKREIPASFEPFQKRWRLSQLGDGSNPEWTIAEEDGSQWSFPASTFENLVAYLEYAACGQVLRNGGENSLPVHAALVAPSESGTIAIIGPGMSGKSTTSTLLWEAGWSLFCDDRCFITHEPSAKVAVAIPIPRRISLRMAGFELLGEETRQAILDDPFTSKSVSKKEPENSRYNFRPSSIRSEPANQSFALRAIVILDPEGSPGPEPAAIAKAIRPLLSSTAIHAHQTPADTLASWLPILDQIPVFRMGRSHPEEMIGHFSSLARQTF